MPDLLLFLFFESFIWVNNEGIIKLLSNYTIIGFYFDNNAFLK